MGIEREYEIVLLPQPEGGFSVFVSELPSIATQGETIEEATEMIKEAIAAYLEVMHKDGVPIPTVHRSSVGVPHGVSSKLPAVSGKRVIAALSAAAPRGQ